MLVTHLTTYTQHENREAKEKRQDRRILQNRTYGPIALYLVVEPQLNREHEKADLSRLLKFMSADVTSIFIIFD